MEKHEAEQILKDSRVEIEPGDPRSPGEIVDFLSGMGVLKTSVELDTAIPPQDLRV